MTLLTCMEEKVAEDERIEVSDKVEIEVAPSMKRGSGLKIVFLSSDTGGGHRASAESLARQFELLYPGTTYDLLDVVEMDGVPPYSSAESWYRHLSSHPAQWKMVYGVSNSRAFEVLADAHLKLMTERAVRRRIRSYDPDVVISVHPLMNSVPVTSCLKIEQETGLHVPFFTVVTDLGSAHCLWFANDVDKLFVASDRIAELARSRGRLSDDKLVLAGLPIRHDFAVQADALGNRMSDAGRAYQRRVREELGLPVIDRKTVLVMGGGEGVGSLTSIVDALYYEFASNGVDALIVVVCGRNEKLRLDLAEKDWEEVLCRGRVFKEEGRRMLTDLSFDSCGGGPLINTRQLSPIPTGCIEGRVTNQLRKILSTSQSNFRNYSSTATEKNPNSSYFDVTETDSTPPTFQVMYDPHPTEQLLAENSKEPEEDEDADFAAPIFHGDTRGAGELAEAALMEEAKIDFAKRGNVTVVGLGFVKRMAEYMVAADVLVSKAGPGTIAEAASLSLPVMLTSFLPGQEEGNVDFVVDGGFGAFNSDADPMGIAEEVRDWIQDEEKLASLSKAAKARGAPKAAAGIAQKIGDMTMEWRKVNAERLKRGNTRVPLA